jgi:hypothetical protein
VNKREMSTVANHSAVNLHVLKRKKLAGLRLQKHFGTKRQTTLKLP